MPRKFITETGIVIPPDKLKKSERLSERHTATLIKKAERINKLLAEFKEEVEKRSKEIYDAKMVESGIDSAKNKGNLTIYNLDRSIKIERIHSEKMAYDDALINAAKEKFKEFLDNSIEARNEFAKELVLDFIQTRTGQLDIRKAATLLKYRNRVGSAAYADGCDLLMEGTDRAYRKMYHRIWRRDENGEYQNVELNFSAV